MSESVKGPHDVALSKKMSWALRHAPEAAGVTLDRAGWVALAELATALGATPEAIRAVVATSPKQRFAISEDGLRVRAQQGHTTSVELDHEAQSPPARLYHGTHVGAVEAIRREGLRPMGRHHVHLSAELGPAREVGARRGRPVVLGIDAAGMAARGVVFRRTPNGVWLVDAVAPGDLIWPEGSP